MKLQNLEGFDPESIRHSIIAPDDWSKAVWTIQRTFPFLPVQVHWDFALPRGRRSSDIPVIVESLRWSLDAVLSPEGADQFKLSVGTAGVVMVGFRELAGWMSFKRIDNFGDLTSERIEEYLQDIPFLLDSRSEFYRETSGSLNDELSDEDGVDFREVDEDFVVPETEECVTSEEPPPPAQPEESRVNNAVNERWSWESEEPSPEDSPSEDDPVTYSAVYGRLLALKIVHAAREKLVKAGLPIMPDSPFRGKSLTARCNEIVEHVTVVTPPLPDEVLVPLLSRVSDYLYLFSDDLIRLYNEHIALRRRISGANNGVLDDRGWSDVRAHLQQFSFSEVKAGSGPWRKPIVEKLRTLDRDGRPVLLGPSGQARRLVSNLRSACLLALSFFAGLRPSEFRSFISKYRTWVQNRTFASCVSVRYSNDGLLEMLFANGLVSKGRPAPVHDDWLIGARPAGSTWLPPVVKALEILERIREPWGEMLDDGPLVMANTNPRGIAFSHDQIKPPDSDTIARDCKWFIRDEVDFTQLPNKSVLGEDLRKFREKGGQQISPRHGRKSFAAFMLETRTSLLEPVRRHYKHVKDSVTESGYFSPDHRLRRLGESEGYAASVIFFARVTRGVPIVGRMAPLVEEFFSGERWSKLETWAEVHREIEHVVQVHSLKIFFSDHSNCLIRANPKKSECRKFKETDQPVWLWNEPALDVRTPSMCAGCACAIMDGSHLPFWEDRANAPIGEDNSRENRVGLMRVKQAQAVVQLIRRAMNSSSVSKDLP